MIYLYNYLTRKKELFKPIKDKQVGLYTCGPTVYDRAHIGNLRTYIFEDILKRTLEYNGHKVAHIMNITDVEDKIIGKMRKKNKTLEQITYPYIKTFYEDIEKLNIKKAGKFPRATGCVKEMIKLVSALLEKEVAYRGAGGSVYFDISKFPNYGSFSRLRKENLKHGVRVQDDEYDKKGAGDFVLWKKAKAGEPSWKAPFGEGRPGWHIECSAMSMKYLGENFDIHAGAADLIFPHHENEIAQSEAVTGRKFVNFWLEGEHLLVEGRKMSKSLGNFYTLEDIEKRKFLPTSFRYLALGAHYRSKLNFTWKILRNAQSSYERLKNITEELKDDRKMNEKYLKEFEKTISDDLNMPRALAVLWKLLRDKKANGKYRTIKRMDGVFGLNLLKKERLEIPEKIKELVNEREKTRAQKKWKKADELREEIEKSGWIVEDMQRGPALKCKKIIHKLST